jgi:hypothetical protein
MSTVCAGVPTGTLKVLLKAPAELVEIVVAFFHAEEAVDL